MIPSATKILHFPARCDRIITALAQASQAGLEPEVLLGADVLIFHGPEAPAWERRRHALEQDAVLFCRALVTHHKKTPDALLRGQRYHIDERGTRPAGSVVIRQTSLEQTARIHAARLRSGRGLHYRRAMANTLATVLEQLADRSAQSFRERVP